MDTRTFNILSACTGAGGLDIGVHVAIRNARTVCYIENEASAIEILASRMDDEGLDEAPIWTDLRTFDGRPWRGVVDLFAAGVPCQPHSVAGKREGASDPRNLWPDARRIIEECAPQSVFIENVAGMLTTGGAKSVCDDMEFMGYRVASGLWTAEEVGASHKRERLFILGMAKEPSGIRELANSKSERRQTDEEHWERQPDVDGCHKVLGDTVVIGLQGMRSTRGQGPQTHAGQTLSGSGGIGLFAPGPSDPRWGDIIKAHPELAPAVESGFCMLDDGVANKLAMSDKLRLTGNGVVPLQAALAFITLASNLTRK